MLYLQKMAITMPEPAPGGKDVMTKIPPVVLGTEAGFDTNV